MTAPKGFQNGKVQKSGAKHDPEEHRAQSQPSPFPTQNLLTWFNKTARPLPWREGYDPYQVAISEMMLQQTQIVTALPYFERWINRWPNWKALAQAKEDEVLAAWEGLGYYQRARRLLACAQQVSQKHEGQLPKEKEALQNLPGLGPYTVAAIRSIAFNEADFPIDGNVRRVLSRFYKNREASPSKSQDAFFSEQLLPEFEKTKQRRELAQAIMELGAMVCRPKNPDCLNCPLQQQCHCEDAEEALSFPVKKAKAKPKVLHLAFICAESKEGLWLRQRPSKGRFPSQWECPNAEASDETSAQREVCEQYGLEQDLVDWQKPFRRDFTTYHVFWHEGVLVESYLFDSAIHLRDMGFKSVARQDLLKINLIPVLAKQYKKNFK
jgi:A/G-specific adenine glycosylase